MATTPEGRVKAKLVDIYKRTGAKYDRAAQTGMGQNGRADDIIRRRPDGHFIGIEVKKLNVADVTKLQAIWLRDCVDGGGSGLVINHENLWLAEWVLTHPCKVAPTFEVTKKGERCLGHNVYPLKNSVTFFVPMNAEQHETPLAGVL